MSIHKRISLIAKSAAVAGAALFAMAAQPAAANIITIGGGVASIECTPSCETFTGGGSPAFPTGPGVLSSSLGDLYDVIPANKTNEASALNILTGTTSFIADDGFKHDVDAGLSFSFDTIAAWIVVKLGSAGTFFIHNTSGAITLNVAYTGASGAGAGFSHYTEFGVVPLPAAFWLMGAGLAGLGFARGRKKAA